MSIVTLAGSTVRTSDIASLELGQRHYMNGTTSTLVVTMRCGRKYRIESNPWVDVYALHDVIKKAMAEEGG
jgi:hypothetical protein